MRKRLKTKQGMLILGGGTLLVVAAAVAAAYFLVFPTSSPKTFAISAPAAGTGTTAAKAKDGGWVIASGSQAGYRVREKLAFLPAKSDAVGRTTAITGTAALGGSASARTVTAAAFKIDVSKLASDKAMRDQRIHQIGLQSDQYPTATFKFSKPITLPAATSSGTVVKVPATGVFAIHGTAKTETVPLQLRLTDSTLQAVGSLTFPWGEFGMTAPSVGGFVNVESTATMEFDLHLKPS